MNTLFSEVNELSPEIQNIVEQYNKHRDRCNKWKKENPEKNCGYSNKYYKQMKEEDPTKYQEYLEKQKEYYKVFKTTPESAAKRKEYYENVIKPRKKAALIII